MDENLVGYLLDALEPDERGGVEAQLAARPELRERLEWLRQTLEPLAADADADSDEPPRGLTVRTLAVVAEHRCRPQQPEPAPATEPAEPPATIPLRRRRALPRADLLVAACLLIVLVPLSVAGLGRLWRNYAQRDVCANNLRLLWTGLQSYADNHDGKFPRVDEDGPRGVAGSFLPVLHDSGALVPEVSPVCPGEAPRERPAVRSMAQMEELYRSDPEQFRAVARQLAGGYAYSMGFREPDGGELFGLSRDDGGDMPILADGWSGAAGNSANHGGAGQNVLYVGGAVRWCTQRTVGVAGDDIYVNRRAEVGAGVDRFDTVLGRGDAGPRPRR
jgi:hypothetical protein